ncbi:XerC/D-like integrase (plasmid) [Natronomonas pharaonis DSM 2160]|uniref:XerC/D-like integrase n=1 Tax=Natronomonas pharaonis (strain ATCC 35678 / DSM 2160 / CIP 103997 / JCM 8858 / NBRC 14720 / NCIMB 2260 / Gabara) TaxID=348780 RepID=Q3IM10_NATPD|nr:phage integrase SAM-like domain-containing protein [Natronomonas pharaonis]CAI50858.1 XerC/D-like integrase [Natronomonas pharaonis DSM 2160]
MTPRERADQSLESSLERYLQDKGKGRGGDGGNYRRNVERELERFVEWAAGEHGRDDWTGITPDGVGREPTFDDIDERTFREYARHLAGDRGLKQNTVKTYYRYISAWCGWCVNEGYLEAHYAQRASAMAPLPDDDGRKPGDQQAWTSDQRHTLTRHVDEQAREAIETYTTLPEETAPIDKQRARYAALKAARDRALVFVLAYTAVRVGELLRDPDDPRRRGVRWEDIDLKDGRMDVYRKKQQWDAASLPDPTISPLQSYRKLLAPPTERWPVFPTFDQRTLAELVKETLAERGNRPDDIEAQRDGYARDLLLALDADMRPPSMTTDGGRSVLQRLSDDAEIDIDHPKHDYLAPHGGRRGMGEVLVRAFGYTVAARYLDNSEEMVRKRYSHIEAGELGDVAAEALDEIDGSRQ